MKLNVPEPIASVVQDLFARGYSDEKKATNSALFRLLEQNCGRIYGEISGLRMPYVPSTGINRNRFKNALVRFFRWTGAPWLEGRTPQASTIAVQLHDAFTKQTLERTIMVPLDHFNPSDWPRKDDGRELDRFTFGPCVIELLDSARLKRIIPIEAFGRNGARHAFPHDEIAGFWWLILKIDEAAEPIWKGDNWSVLDTDFGAIGTSPIFEPVFPQILEDALFVVFLSIPVSPRVAPWEPFGVPWTYSFTNDPFQYPPTATQPEKLSWTIVGSEDEQFEVPDRSEATGVRTYILQRRLRENWKLLSASMLRAGTTNESLNPLAKHFFVKAFTEHGIDQAIMNLGSLEATFMLRKERRQPMFKRLGRMTGSKRVLKEIKRGNDFRDRYLHSLGATSDTISWHDLARIRWATTKAMKSYLNWTKKFPKLSRRQLLKKFAN